MKDRVIVSCGIGRHYEDGLASLRQHCEIHCPDADLLSFGDYPPGCPSQHEQMYAFKIFALRQAVAAGYRRVLWIDSAFQPVGSLDPLWETVERDGWYVPPQLDAKLGNWCSDHALKLFGLSRVIASGIPLVYSGLVGMDLDSVVGKRLWALWESLYEAGTFNGPHKNLPGEPVRPWGQKWEGHVSDDPEVFGHRHDESALSYALYVLGLKPVARGFLTIETPDGFIGHHVPLEAACLGA